MVNTDLHKSPTWR